MYILAWNNSNRTLACTQGDAVVFKNLITNLLKYIYSMKGKIDAFHYSERQLYTTFLLLHVYEGSIANVQCISHMHRQGKSTWRSLGQWRNMRTHTMRGGLNTLKLYYQDWWSTRCWWRYPQHHNILKPHQVWWWWEICNPPMNWCLTSHQWVS